jgi:drug/metabolite transporter (DMT)-like permease
MFSTMALFVRIAKTDFSTSQLVFARAVFGIVLFSWFCRREVMSLFKLSSKSLWLRAIFGGGSVTCYYINLRDLPLGTATILTDLAPIFVAIFSFLFFNEKLSVKTVAGVLVAVSGAALLSSPATDSSSFCGIVIGLLGAVLGAWAYLSLKRASGTFSSAAVVFAFSVALLFVSILGDGPIFPMKTGANLLPVIGVVATSALAQVLLTVSYRHLSATIASTLGLTAVLWALLFDVAVLGTELSAMALTAIVLIATGVRLTQLGRPRPNTTAEPEQAPHKAANQ